MPVPGTPIPSALEHDPALDRSPIDTVQDLVRASLDSERTFHRAADLAKDADLIHLFRMLARRRRYAATELSDWITSRSVAPATTGTRCGTYRRMWIGVRSSLSRSHPSFMLIDLDRMEKRTRMLYERAVLMTRGEEVHDLICRQFQMIVIDQARLIAAREELEPSRPLPIAGQEGYGS